MFLPGKDILSHLSDTFLALSVAVNADVNGLVGLPVGGSITTSYRDGLAIPSLLLYKPMTSLSVQKAAPETALPKGLPITPCIILPNDIISFSYCHYRLDLQSPF